MDDWSRVESWFAELDQLEAWRATIAAMRRLIAAIRADPRFHDLYPSASHACLVFRRDAKRAVLVSWNDDGTYGVAFVEHPFEIREGRSAAECEVLDVLLGCLE